MDNSLNKKLLIKVIITCSIFLFLISFYYHIDKYTSGFIYFILTLLIPISFVLMVIYFIKSVIQIFRNIKQINFSYCLPTLVALLTLTYFFFCPYRLDSENLCSKVKLRACYEGTQNQAHILFRENQTFEIHWTGVNVIFLYSIWNYGIYSQKADTLFLYYETNKPYRFGDSILNTGEYLITINKNKIDNEQYFVNFYLGFCKGYN